MLGKVLDKLKGKAPKGKRRSKYWRKVRKAFIKKNPRCACCDSKYKIEVHHIQPFHSNPELELVESNLITLCENKKYGITCHQLIGHRGDYRKINVDVVRDAAYWKSKIKS